MSTLKEAPQTIEWPVVQIGAEKFTLRYSYTSNYLLTKWKKTIGTATNIELAASMCGRFDSKGKWRSAGFENPVELADMLSEVDPDEQTATETALLTAITDALKKAFPALEVAQSPAQPGTMATTKTESSDSGPSQLHEVA
jgi:hypothetical protein